MTEMRKYFVDNCISIVAFARKHDLDESTLSRVLSGEIRCERRGGNTEKIAKVLWELGIWQGDKPKVLQKIENDERGG